MDYRGQSIASDEWFHVAATYQLDVSEVSNSPPPAPGSALGPPRERLSPFKPPLEPYSWTSF